MAVAFAGGCSEEDAAGTDDGVNKDSGNPINDDATVRPDAPSDSSKTDAPSDGSKTDANDGASDAADAADADADAADAADADADAVAPPPPIDVYDPTTVKSYQFTFDAAAIATLSLPPDPDPSVNINNDTWVHGDFTYDGVTLLDVGFRRKGSSTFRSLPQKAAFKVKFDKYVPGQKWAGLKELTFNNSVSDPTFLAERLSYHVFRSVGLPASRTAAAQITINGSSYGLYTCVETPNKDLIQRAFGPGVPKTLYEINYGGRWLPGYEGGFDEKVGDGTLSDVKALFQVVNTASSATLINDVSAHLDTTEWLRFSATEAAVGHYDGYGFGIFGNETHNYFMAGDVNGVFSLMPWSTDLTMSDRETAPLATVNANAPTGVSTLLVRCKASATCWPEYVTQVQSVLTAYEALDLVTLAQTWHAQISAMVLADPKFTNISWHNQATAQLYPWLAARPAVIRAQLGI